MLSFLFVALASKSVDQPIQLGDLLCHPRRLLAKFETLRQARTSLPRGCRLLKWIPELDIAILETPQGQLQQTRSWMRGHTRAQWVEFDRAARPAYQPNDPLWPDMWHMTAIKADLAWDHTFGGPSAVVAVIDTGVNLAHEDLAPNAWVNTGEVPGNSIDDDNNGYVDDVNGYDFAYGDSNPDDVYGHGTACAGLVAAVQDNGLGVTGVAPRARIMAVKAAIDSGFFYDSATVPAYIYATNMGAKVFSMSFFSDRVSAAEGAAIHYAATHGVLPVAAAGNDSTVYPYYPAAYDDTLSVAALTTGLNKAGFSNHGYWVDVAAPGVGLRTTTKDGGYTDGFAGTSGACPHVAGLAALLFGADPSATVEEVRAAIEDTATPVNQGSYGVYCNYGIINCEAAAIAILGSPAPPRAPAVRLVTGVGQQVNDVAYTSDVELVFRVHGRGFATASTASVSIGGVDLPIVERTRDWITAIYLPPVFGPLEVRLDGSLVSSIQTPFTYSMVYPLLNASTPENGASSTGGFSEALNADSSFVRVTRNNDDGIVMHATFRKVKPADFNLVVRRRYANTSVGTETIQLYDWSSASYPYGSFVTISSGAAPTTMTTSTFALTDSWRFIDPEGSVYLRILTSNDLPSGAELRLDLAHLALR